MSLSHEAAPDTHLGMRLTNRQADVLGVVLRNGPVTPGDVAYHLPISESSARGLLARLEAKGLIDAVYTGHGGGGRAYTAYRSETARQLLDERDAEPLEGE